MYLLTVIYVIGVIVVVHFVCSQFVIFQKSGCLSSGFATPCVCLNVCGFKKKKRINTEILYIDQFIGIRLGRTSS
jgi:hypothetical protein